MSVQGPSSLPDSTTRRAAEALIEVAIWRRRLRSDGVSYEGTVSDETRRSLTDLVLRDPAMVAFLFTDEAWERH